MAEDRPRLARLAAIVTQLQSKRLLTAREIAERYQVSIRTVYRDIRTLEQSGVPIQTEEAKSEDRITKRSPAGEGQYQAGCNEQLPHRAASGHHQFPAGGFVLPVTG